MKPPDEIPDDAVLATASRSGAVESWHRGCVVVVEGDHTVVALGDADRRIFCRSAAKPFQALPLLESGIDDRLQVPPRELAVMMASHNGTADHVGAVRSLLARGGRTEDDLQCGPHAPFDRSASLDIARRGEKPARIHNNCSGKHAGFLLQASEAGVPAGAYLEPDCASQARVRRTVAEMVELDPGDLRAGVDGCGAATFAMPLRQLAVGFRNLTNPERLPPVRARACRRLLAAAWAEPVLMAGEGRFCTALLRAAPQAVFGKNGAEGVYALGLAGRRIGIAVKISDGNERGYWPVLVDLLTCLGLWSEVPEALRDFHRVPICNTRRQRVGEVVSVAAF